MIFNPTTKRYIACFLWLLPVLGCRPNSSLQPGQTLPRPGLPPDFALQFHVAGDPSTNDPLRQTSQYVLEANRHLHVATGPTATRHAYPPLTRVIPHAEYEHLIRHVMRSHLMAEPTSPAAESSNATLRYEVTLFANGRTHRYATTPAESPPTVQLLQKLVKTRSPAAKNRP